jgi:hypothetical protein
MAFADACGVFPWLETRRLVLRQLLPEDADEYHRQQAAPAIPGLPLGRRLRRERW